MRAARAGSAFDSSGQRCDGIGSDEVGSLKTDFSQDSGSIAPLAVGLAGILLAAACTFLNVGSLLLFQQRETQTAEAIALSVLGELSDIEVQNSRSQPEILQESAKRFVVEAGILVNFEVATRDGLTVEAKVCGNFVAPIFVPLIDLGDEHEVCGLARARRL